jgi:uncharacterized protein involved in outer membrane biogenesis
MESFLKTGAKLDSVKVNLFDSSAVLKGLQINHPPELGEGCLAAVDNIKADFALFTLMEDTVVLPQIHLQGLTLNVVGTEYGWNTDVFEEDVFSESADESSGEGQKKFSVEKVLISPLSVNLSYGDKSFEIELDEIVLTEIGVASGPGRLLLSVSQQALRAIMKELRQNHRQHFENRFKEDVKSAIRKKADELKEIFRQRLQKIF